MVVLLVGIALVWLFSTSAEPPLTTRFVGYTNGTTGRLALFVVSNASPRQYVVLAYYSVQEREGKWSDGVNAFGFHIGPGTSFPVTVPAPVRRSWRASLACELSRTGEMRADHLLLADAADLGLPTRYRRFHIQTDWIDQ